MENLQITEDDKKFLDENRIHHETLTKAFYMRSLSGEVRTRMQSIIAHYWQAGYITDLWCGPCVSDMVLKLYRHYDEWLEQQKQEQPVELTLEIKAPEPPKAEPVKASFPSHKKHQRK